MARARRTVAGAVAVAVVGLVVAANGAWASFSAAPGSPFGVGNGPFSVAVGDFDGINGPDLAVANFLSDQVTVLLNDGSGGFAPAAGSPLAVGNGPSSVAVGDFDGINGPDLAVANFLSDQVTVLLNDGSGGFAPAAGSPLAVGDGPTSVAVGDFDGADGPDLAVTSRSDDSLTVLLNNGSGGFSATAGSPIAGGDEPLSVAVGDFDGADGPDLAVANISGDNVTVLLNDGSGGFALAAGSPLAVGDAPRSVAVGDFDGINGPDLAVANVFDDNMTVLLNDGSGGFSPAPGSPLVVGNGPASVAVGDFDGVDGPDLAVSNISGDDLTVLLNDGSGGFAPAAGSPFAVGRNPASVAVGDFDGVDGLDLAVANQSDSNVTVLLNDGSPGTPADPCDLPPPMGYNLIDGTDGPNTLTGTPGNDFIRGLGGDDVIDGNGGSDILCGGEGNDRIWSKRNKGNGDKGPDVISGGGGHDRIVGGPAGNLIFGGAGDDVIDVLGSGEDEIYGGDGDDVIMAGGGADHLDGGPGHDDLGGGAGDDTLVGDDGDDDFFAGAGTDSCDGGAGTNTDVSGECESGP